MIVKIGRRMQKSQIRMAGEPERKAGAESRRPDVFGMDAGLRDDARSRTTSDYWAVRPSLLGGRGGRGRLPDPDRDAVREFRLAARDDGVGPLQVADDLDPAWPAPAEFHEHFADRVVLDPEHLRPPGELDDCVERD